MEEQAHFNIFHIEIFQHCPESDLILSFRKKIAEYTNPTNT